MEIKEFKQKIQQGVHIINIYAGWCTPCTMLLPILDQLEDNFKNKIKIRHLDVNNNIDKILEEYKITCIPTLLFFKNGKLKETSIGINDYKSLESIINNILNER